MFDAYCCGCTMRIFDLGLVVVMIWLLRFLVGSFRLVTAEIVVSASLCLL